MDVADMLEEMDDSGFTDTSPDRKIAMLNDALYDAASRELWPHLQTTLTLTFNGSSDTPTNLPADYDKALDVVHMTAGTKLEWTSLSSMEGFDLTTRSAAADRFYEVGKQLRFWPIPEATFTARLRYMRVPAAMEEGDLEAVIDWPRQHHRVLVLGGLQRLYDMEDDPELAVRAEQKYEERLTRMAMAEFNRSPNRPSHIVMDPTFDYDPFD